MSTKKNPPVVNVTTEAIVDVRDAIAKLAGVVNQDGAVTKDDVREVNGLVEGLIQDLRGVRGTYVKTLRVAQSAVSREKSRERVEKALKLLEAQEAGEESGVA